MRGCIDALPDELIKDILSSVLFISDDQFSRAISVFGRNANPTSHTLLVSKRWLRVATPLLYNCVVLRNTAQAQAFQDALRGKSGILLKGFVRKVRLDGCFGAVVNKIFAGIPGVTDLFITLPCNSEEKVNGICRGLTKLSPVHVVFDFTEGSLWKNSFEMANALCEAILRWQSLSTFELYIPRLQLRSGTRDSESTRLVHLAAALARASNLRLVVIHFSMQDTGSATNHLVAFVKTIGTNSSVQAIHLHFQGPQSRDLTLEGLVGDPSAHVVYYFLSNETCHSTPLSPTEPKQHKAIPALPEEIYRRIVEIDLQLFHVSLETDNDTARLFRERCLCLMHVSSMFYEITRPLAFSFIHVSTPNALSDIADKMSKSDIYPSFVRVLRIRPYIDISFTEDTIILKSDNVVADCSLLFRCLPNVKELSIPTTYMHLFSQVRDEFKANLRRLALQINNARLSLRVLELFSNLQSLVFEGTGCLGLSYIEPGITKDIKQGRVCLGKVTSVKLIGNIDKEVLTIIRLCEFPSVQSLEISTSEYRRTSINETQSRFLASFPNLKKLIMRGSMQVRYLHIPEGHTSLEKIVLSSRLEVRREDLQSGIGSIAKIFDEIDFNQFKALKELQLASVKEWPWQDRELKNNAWQERAQVLVQTYGITITDAAGTQWKPRMQKRTGRK